MSDIPADVYREILRRVPVESLFRFRSVCKSWRHIIDDPVFANSHLGGRSGDGDRLIICEATGCELDWLPLNSLDFSTERVQDTNIKNLVVGDGVPSVCVFPMISCRGLMLITPCGCKKTDVSLLWNPSTGECLELPLCQGFCERVEGRDSPASGLGYDAGTNDYKAVRIVQSGPRVETFIYSLNTDSWHKTKEDCHDCVIRRVHCCAEFAFGALHWIAHEGVRSAFGCILSLDLGSETYRKLSLPSEITDTMCYAVVIRALDEDLFCSRSHREGHRGCLEVWMIKDYGCGDVWVKMLSMEGRVSSQYKFQLIAFLQSQECILIRGDKKLLSYDLKSKCTKDVNIPGFPEYFFAQVVPASLIRLNRSCHAADGIVATEVKRG